MPNEIAGRFLGTAAEPAAQSDVSPLGWRARRSSGGLDRATKRLAAFAGGIAVALAAIVGGWSLMGHGSAPVPVIDAPGGPLRVKPENRGGMQVTGLDDPILSGESGNEKAALAPPPEMPEPKALHPRREAEKPKPVTPPASHEAAIPPPPPVAAVVPVASVAPLAKQVPIPARTAANALPSSGKPASLAAKPAALGEQATAQPSRATQVQLAALKSEDAAKAEWEHLVKQMPDLLRARHPAVERTERDGHVFWRLRTGGFADHAQAAQFCEHVRAKRGDCAVASF